MGKPPEGLGGALGVWSEAVPGLIAFHKFLSPQTPDQVRPREAFGHQPVTFPCPTSRTLLPPGTQITPVGPDSLNPNQLHPEALQGTD